MISCRQASHRDLTAKELRDASWNIRQWRSVSRTKFPLCIFLISRRRKGEKQAKRVAKESSIPSLAAQTRIRSRSSFNFGLASEGENEFGSREQCCRMAKFDPFLSLDCARVEGGGVAKHSRAIVLQAGRAKRLESNNLAIAVWQP